MTTPTPEQQAKARDIKHYKYVGGGMYRDSRVPQGETADVIHGEQMMEVIANLIVAERDSYREQLEDYRRRFDIEASQEKCQTCGKYNSPSLIESGECLHCICKTYREKADELDKIRAAVLAKFGYATVTLTEVVQALEKAEALDWLEENWGDYVSEQNLIDLHSDDTLLAAINAAKKR